MPRPEPRAEPLVEVLEWDSAWWGVTTGRFVATGDLADADIARLVADARARAVELLYLRVPGSSSDAAQAAERHGFRFVDVRLRLERPVDPMPGPGAADPSVRFAGHEDVDRLRAIAGTSHRNTRFHADPRLAGDRCDELYRHWIATDLADPATAVFVDAGLDGPHGYLSATVAGAVGEVRLVAVAASHRTQGIAERLLGRALGWMRDEGATSASVVTQGGSVPAQRLYQRQGFRTAEVALWFHGWSADLSSG